MDTRVPPPQPPDYECDPAIRDAARPILEQTRADREAGGEQIRGGSRPERGHRAREQVFRSVCAKCHRLNGYGAEVGPDLPTVRDSRRRAADQHSDSERVDCAGLRIVRRGDRRAARLDGVIGPQPARPR